MSHIYDERDRLLACVEMLESKDISGAVEMLEKQEFCLPFQPWACELYILAYYRLGEFRKALTWAEYGYSISEQKQLFQEYIFECIEALDNTEKTIMKASSCKNIAHAIGLYQEFVKAYPNVISGYVLCGLVLSASGKHNVAGKFYEEALQKDHNNDLVRKQLYESSSLKYAFLKSAGYISATVAVSACLALLIFIIKSSQLSIHANKLDTQYDELQGKYIELESKYFSIHNDKVVMEQENSTLARYLKDEQEEVIRLNTAIQQGHVYTEEMKHQIKTAIMPQRLFDYAFKLYKSQQYRECLERMSLLYSYTEEGPIKQESLYFKNRSYQMLNKIDEAIEGYEAYLTIYPGTNYYDDSLYYLANLYYGRSNFDKAREMASRIIEELPESIFCNNKIQEIVRVK